MSLIINSTTIPTSGNYVKVGNTNLTKVNVVKGGVTTTVWEKRSDPITYDKTNILSVFPNRWVSSTGAMCSQDKNNMSAGGHSTGGIELSCWVSTGNFNLPEGAKSLTATFGYSYWGEKSGTNFSCTCGTQTQTKYLGGGAGGTNDTYPSESFTFDVTGLSSTTVTFGFSRGGYDTGGNGDWFGAVFRSLVIGFV